MPNIKSDLDLAVLFEKNYR